MVSTLLGGPGTARPVTVAITTSTTKANVASKITLTNQVFGSLDDSVTWFVNGVAGGSASLGTIQTVDHFTATYLAPDPLDALQSVVLEARSSSRPDVAASIVVPLTNYRWAQLPVGLTNLDIRDINYSTDGSRLYAATTGGLFRSDDGGAHWQSATASGDPSLAGVVFQSVTVDPTNPLVVYAGTYGRGIFKTSDGGATWIAMNTLADNPFTNLSSAIVVRIEVSRSNPATVLAEVSTVLDAAFGLREGSFRSTDGGATWLRLGGFAGTDAAIDQVTFDPTSANAVFGRSFQGHIVRSTNLGDTFTDFGSPPSFAITELKVDPFDGNHLIVSGRPTITLLDGSSASDFPTLMETRDGGATWRSAAAGLGAGNNFLIRFSPSRAEPCWP